MDRERMLGLDATRGVAALSVMLFHFTQVRGRHVLLPNSYLAVDLFFCLSGLVLWRAYAARLAQGLSLRRLMLERVIRLYPIYLVGAVLGLCSLALMAANGRTDVSVFQALGRIWVLFPDFSGHAIMQGDDRMSGLLFPENNPSWSLFFEVLLAPLLFLLRGLGRWGGWLLAGLLMWGWLKLSALLGQNMAGGWSVDTFWLGFPRSAYAFVVGACLGMGPAPGQILRRVPPGVVVGVVSLMLLVCWSLPVSVFGTANRMMLLVAGGLIPLLVWLHHAVPLVGRAAVWARRIGEWSYPVYVIHMPVLLGLNELSWLFTHHAPSLQWLLPTAICLSLLAAHVLARHVDVPGRRWLGAHLLRQGN